MSEHVFSGLRVLLVEDESLVAILAEDLLIEAGCKVLLPMRLDHALEVVASERFDVAVLDVNLGGGMTTFPLAHLLDELGTPFVFATGYGPVAVLANSPKHQVIRKPYEFNSLCEAVSRALARNVAD